jgi:ferric-dicitrate binding protein FerR (iron transport regulator)
MATFHHQLYGLHVAPARPLRPWPRIAAPDLAPAPKPLVMGPLAAADASRPAMARVQTRWQTHAKPTFPIRPADDPVRQMATNERRGMTLLTLVVCATLTVALLGIGLQVLQ